MEEKNITAENITSILAIETALPGKWETDNGNLFLVFEAIPETGGKGTMEAISNISTGQFRYEVFIKEGNPFLNVIDEKKDEIHEYEITEINTEKNLLRLKRESKPELSLHRKR